MRVFVAMVLLVAMAHADAKTAAVHDRQAKAYFEAKQYDAAIDEFKKSHAQDKKPITLFKIASAYYAKADFAAAIDFYGQYLLSDPNGPYAQQALEFTTIAKKALDDEKAKREAQAEAARKAEADKAAAEDAQKRRVLAESHMKNAAAFEKANAWASAGDAYRAATEADGDPAHLLDAAAAYRKQPDYVKASEAYRAYIAKVPNGPQSDDVRARLADTSRALEEEQEKQRVAAATATEPRDAALPKQPFVARWQWAGPRAAAGLSAADTNPLRGKNGGLRGETSFDIGAFAMYLLAPRVAFRPEAALIYRSARFESPGDANGDFDSISISRAGLAVAAPFMFSLVEGDFSLRLGAGPYIAVLPVFRTSISGPMVDDVKDNQLIEPGGVVGAELDFGLVSIELRFTQAVAIGPSGQIADDFKASSRSFLAGLALSFDIPR